MSDIIKDAGALSKHIASTLTTYANVATRIHVAAVSALWHVAKHGDPTHLNRLHEGLRPNDQSALRLYVRRSHILSGLIEAKLIGEDDGIPTGDEALPSEVIQAAHEAGQVLDFKQKEFIVVNGHNSKQAVAMAGLCERRFINPNGETDLPVLQRDNVTEVRTLGDAEALKALLRAVKSIESNSKTRNVSVSDKVRKMFERIKNDAEAMAKQFDLASTAVSLNNASQNSSTNTKSTPKRRPGRPRKAAAAVVH